MAQPTTLTAEQIKARITGFGSGNPSSSTTTSTNGTSTTNGGSSSNSNCSPSKPSSSVQGPDGDSSSSLFNSSYWFGSSSSEAAQSAFATLSKRVGEDLEKVGGVTASLSWSGFEFGGGDGGGETHSSGDGTAPKMGGVPKMGGGYASLGAPPCGSLGGGEEADGEKGITGESGGVNVGKDEGKEDKDGSKTNSDNKISLSTETIKKVNLLDDDDDDDIRPHNEDVKVVSNGGVEVPNGDIEVDLLSMGTKSPSPQISSNSAEKIVDPVDPDDSFLNHLTSWTPEKEEKQKSHANAATDSRHGGTIASSSITPDLLLVDAVDDLLLESAMPPLKSEPIRESTLPRDLFADFQTTERGSEKTTSEQTTSTTEKGRGVSSGGVPKPIGFGVTSRSTTTIGVTSVTRSTTTPQHRSRSMESDGDHLTKENNLLLGDESESKKLQGDKNTTAETGDLLDAAQLGSLGSNLLDMQCYQKTATISIKDIVDVVGSSSTSTTSFSTSSDPTGSQKKSSQSSSGPKKNVLKPLNLFDDHDGGLGHHPTGGGGLLDELELDGGLFMDTIKTTEIASKIPAANGPPPTPATPTSPLVGRLGGPRKMDSDKGKIIDNDICTKEGCSGSNFDGPNLDGPDLDGPISHPVSHPSPQVSAPSNSNSLSPNVRSNLLGPNPMEIELENFSPSRSDRKTKDTKESTKDTKEKDVAKANVIFSAKQCSFIKQRKANVCISPPSSPSNAPCSPDLASFEEASMSEAPEAQAPNQLDNSQSSNGANGSSNGNGFMTSPFMPKSYLPTNSTPKVKGLSHLSGYGEGRTIAGTVQAMVPTMMGSERRGRGGGSGGGEGRGESGIKGSGRSSGSGSSSTPNADLNNTSDLVEKKSPTGIKPISELLAEASSSAAGKSVGVQLTADNNSGGSSISGRGSTNNATTNGNATSSAPSSWAIFDDLGQKLGYVRGKSGEAKGEDKNKEGDKNKKSTEKEYTEKQSTETEEDAIPNTKSSEGKKSSSSSSTPAKSRASTLQSPAERHAEAKKAEHCIEALCLIRGISHVPSNKELRQFSGDIAALQCGKEVVIRKIGDRLSFASGSDDWRDRLTYLHRSLHIPPNPGSDDWRDRFRILHGLLAMRNIGQMKTLFRLAARESVTVIKALRDIPQTADVAGRVLDAMRKDESAAREKGVVVGPFATNGDGRFPVAGMDGSAATSSKNSTNGSEGKEENDATHEGENPRSGSGGGKNNITGGSCSNIQNHGSNSSGKKKDNFSTSTQQADGSKTDSCKTDSRGNNRLQAPIVTDLLDNAGSGGGHRKTDDTKTSTTRTSTTRNHTGSARKDREKMQSRSEKIKQKMEQKQKKFDEATEGCQKQNYDDFAIALSTCSGTPALCGGGGSSPSGLCSPGGLLSNLSSPDSFSPTNLGLLNTGSNLGTSLGLGCGSSPGPQIGPVPGPLGPLGVVFPHNTRPHPMRQDLTSLIPAPPESPTNIKSPLAKSPTTHCSPTNLTGDFLTAMSACQYDNSKRGKNGGFSPTGYSPTGYTPTGPLHSPTGLSGLYSPQSRYNPESQNQKEDRFAALSRVDFEERNLAHADDAFEFVEGLMKK